jgi:hypothetical protein
VSVLTALARAAGRPAEAARAWLRFGSAMARVGPAAAARWAGADVPPPVPADERDRQFADPAWAGNPAYFALRQAYLAARRLGEDLLAAGRGDPLTDQKAKLALGFAFDALAPTNVPAGNPAALKKAFDTGGASVLAGARNFAGDLARNRGPAAAGGHVLVRARPQPGGDAGARGVPQRADGAHPVRPADRAGACRAAAGQPAGGLETLARHCGQGP